MVKNENSTQFTVVKQTPSRQITITCKSTVLDSEEILKYMDHEKVKACKEGCPNYGKKWSCPPYSKDYLRIKRDYQYACLIVLSTNMSQYLDIKNKYLAIKAANVTLKTTIEKIARYLEEQWKGTALLSGSCRLCKPCNCKLGKSCKHPDKMRYSMEAAHLDVGKLTEEKMSHPLLWYQNKILPEYTSTVALVLTNENKEQLQFKGLLENIISH